jgi:hypothetical protein
MFRRSAGGAVIVSFGLALSGCGAPQPAAAPECRLVTDLVPESGILSGVNLDWERETLAEYASNLGRRPAVVVSFSPFPMSEKDKNNVDAAFEQVKGNGGTLLLTLEPHEGLAEVTKDRADALAKQLAGYNKAGVPVIVRFAHEMNGSWYEWGQKPVEYIAAYRTVADAVHQQAPGSDMMWAPNYGGGYPFSGGQNQAVSGSADAAALDTDGDGSVSAADDPYQPYYPGDDAVDWVGMSLYHWGNTYPWGANVLPEEGKFLQQLTGTYNGAGGNDLAVPDFYKDYGEGKNKPVAIPETAALSIPSREGASPLAIKQAWWKQLFDPAIPREYPELKMINWFEWDKLEVEVKDNVDWTVAQDPTVRDAYIADLPSWFVSAGEPKACTPKAS